MDITDKLKKQLLDFLQDEKKADLINSYLFFIEKENNLKPVLFPQEKKIYKSLDELLDKLENEKKLYRETEIKIRFGSESVNEETKKIYICPFTGKVFGDNTHPNPQDAIYDWVSKCKENTERIGGLKSKRFFVSEDPEIIAKYITKRKEPITKIVFSSVITGKLFNSKKAVIDDFKKHHVKFLTLMEVQNQNKFQIEDSLLKFIEKNLTEEKIKNFVNLLANYKEFEPYLEQWVG
ncbi:MAG: hypothetical protein A2888_03605 [Chlamydiae bacterium RIFCSPLOWO2_01_FULL_28_7]|nr:MAG: hypothetical protein A2888_03605 [Chlamydiae bacterium RIFCSPLOWO2_01_FULL_28_7]